MRAPRLLTPQGEIVRLLALRLATETRGCGLGWCLACEGGGWAGPLDGHYAAAARTLGRQLTPDESEDFCASFLAMLRLYPPEACEMHRASEERASA